MSGRQSQPKTSLHMLKKSRLTKARTCKAVLVEKNTKSRSRDHLLADVPPVQASEAPAESAPVPIPRRRVPAEAPPVQASEVLAVPILGPVLAVTPDPAPRPGQRSVPFALPLCGHGAFLPSLRTLTLRVHDTALPSLRTLSLSGSGVHNPCTSTA
ncbi:unnamed protein product [Pleuronectes platessa]|uniref:Uncharacterized protein n=1 Tax=Pleuronectes platessa TaxID=8262 RepID=A0A9N7U7J3_PLEPL|nr:unnamed protein product [Pleuronectes platessa]